MPQAPDPSQNVEEAFVAYLKAHSDFRTLPDGPDLIQIEAGSNRKVEVVKPYIMVLCDDYDQRGQDRFTFTVSVIYVQSINGDNDVRKAWTGKVFDRLRLPEAFGHENIIIRGWSQPVPKELSDRHDTGDSFRFRGGGEVQVG